MMPDYETVDSFLLQAGAGTQPAEGHGTLCGMLCANPATQPQRWIGEMLEQVDETADELSEARAMLGQIFDETSRQFADSALGFYPLLPDDETPLDVRVEALGQWCQGFLYGMAMGGFTDPSALQADGAEVLRDFADIALGGFEFDEEGADELAYAEISEYVRVGVLLVNEELQPARAAPRLH